MAVVWGLVLGAGLVLVLAALLGRGERESRKSAPGRLETLLAQAGLRLAPSTLIAVSVLVGLATAALTWALLPILAIAAALGAVAAAVPTMSIVVRARARRRATRVLWPDVVDQLVSSIRSGQSLPDSLAGLALTGPVDARGPFAHFAETYRASADLGACLTDLKERLADPTADRIVETIRMSREVGGSELTTVLRNLSSYLRQEAALRSEVEGRQSWVVNAARLGVAAPWVVLLLLASRPEAMAAYNTTAGAVLILVGLGVSVLAYRVMLAIGRIPEERRWFR